MVEIELPLHSAQSMAIDNLKCMFTINTSTTYRIVRIDINAFIN
jgi:hypothetical protein